MKTDEFLLIAKRYQKNYMWISSPFFVYIILGMIISADLLSLHRHLLGFHAGSMKASIPLFLAITFFLWGFWAAIEISRRIKNNIGCYCPNCGKQIVHAAEAVAKTGDCPFCNRRVLDLYDPLLRIKPLDSNEMNTFLENEKTRQTEFKKSAPYFSKEALEDGLYKGKSRPFCLPVEYAIENLFPEIRRTACDFFDKHSIKWHDGNGGNPSNHLCDSQVCCVNFLLPFFDKPDALAKLLRRIFPDIVKMLPVEDCQYVTFEWIGKKNYLGEKVPRSGLRTRGAYHTSADAAVRFERKDGKIQVVLIEWKYTESYGVVPLIISKNGTNRTAIYRPFYNVAGCPINEGLIPGFYSLFYKPFYQFMRQQFLANEMEKAHELDADIVNVLHISPSHNTAFKRITSPDLGHLGETATGVWKKLLRKDDRFIAVSTETLFGNFYPDQFPELDSWLEYIRTRYSWLSSLPPA